MSDPEDEGPDEADEAGGSSSDKASPEGSSPGGASPDGASPGGSSKADQAVADASMRAALLSVATVALAITVVSAAFAGLRFAAGAAIGGVLATANLAVFARLGDAFLAGRGKAAPWGVVAMLKLVFLFGGVWLILKSELVSGISLAIGYAALPFGITLGSLFGPRPAENPADLAGGRKKEGGRKRTTSA